MQELTRRLGFIFGCPRSGTTWLQRLLGAHPQIAAPQESHIGAYLKSLIEPFDESVASIRTAISAAARGDPPPNRVIGLPAILTERDVLDVGRLLVEKFVARALAAKAGARVAIEKGSNISTVSFIDRVAPEAVHIVLVRHPMEVVSSLVRAGRGWGADWAPSSASDAAAWWAWFVDLGESLVDRGEGRAIRIRYEDLVESPGVVLPQVLRHLGVNDTDDQMSTLLSKAPAGAAGEWTYVMGGEGHRMSQAAGLTTWPEPDGFGEGRPPRWQDVLSEAEIAGAIEKVALAAERLEYGLP